MGNKIFSVDKLELNFDSNLKFSSKQQAFLVYAPYDIRNIIYNTRASTKTLNSKASLPRTTQRFKKQKYSHAGADAKVSHPSHTYPLYRTPKIPLMIPTEASPCLESCSSLDVSTSSSTLVFSPDRHLTLSVSSPTSSAFCPS